MASYNPDKANVAAVCGNEMRVYGWKEKNGARPLRFVQTFPNHGQAKIEAEEYDNREKQAAARREG